MLVTDMLYLEGDDRALMDLYDEVSDCDLDAYHAAADDAAADLAY